MELHRFLTLIVFPLMLQSEADHYRKLEVGASTPFARELFAEKAKALNKKMAKMTQRNGGGTSCPY